MIIVDRALQEREAQGNPVRVAVVGAGYMGRGMAQHIINEIPGMRLVAMSNRTLAKAEEAYHLAGVETVQTVRSLEALEQAIEANQYAVTEDAMLLCAADGVDAVVEATGAVEFGAHVAVQTIDHGKHVVLMNAELDATVGPILKVRADQAGVVITNVDGDQPGSIMNLFRFVKTTGYRPVLAGNIKGLYDPYRTPETQKAFAEAHNQKPKMVTSFADGTKISMEMAVVANATGFRVGQRGMYGPECDHVNEAVDLFPQEEMLEHGLVDYILGAEPGPGVFVIGHCDDPVRQQYMKYFKMGDGPFYVFYTPYHLPHIEAPLTVARAVLFEDATITPQGAPVADVIAVAKHDLKAGDTIDGLGGFACYGLLDNADVVRRDNLLPMGLAEGCRLKRDIPRDEVLSFDDVNFPSGRLIDKLWNQQNEFFDLHAEGSARRAS
jgi:predicted homoserine dehydrogenase-like protein